MQKVRKAVGAIIVCPKEKYRFLIIQKASISDVKNGKHHKITPYWDIPKGGLKATDSTELYALKRELTEELGTDKFEFLNQIDKKLAFNFDPATKSRNGFHSQETSIYFVKFLGTSSDIKVDDDEITAFKFVDYKIALKLIDRLETRAFLEASVQNEIIKKLLLKPEKIGELVVQ